MFSKTQHWQGCALCRKDILTKSTRTSAALRKLNVMLDPRRKPLPQKPSKKATKLPKIEQKTLSFSNCTGIFLEGIGNTLTAKFLQESSET